MLVYSLEPLSNHVFVHSAMCSHMASVKFPTAQISVWVYPYAVTRNVRTGVQFELSGWVFHRWRNKLWATYCFFFTFSIRGIPDSQWDLSQYLKLNHRKSAYGRFYQIVVNLRLNWTKINFNLTLTGLAGSTNEVTSWFKLLHG